MGKTLAMDELRKLPESDLLREISREYRAVARLKIAVGTGKEKNSALLRKERDQLARMLTVLNELRKKPQVSVAVGRF